MSDLSNNIVIHIKKDECEYLQFKELLKYGIKHAYGLIPGNYRTLGNNVDKNKYNNAIENYKLLCDAINVDYKNLIKPVQSHTNNVEIVDEKIDINEANILNNIYKPNYESFKFNNTDGLITTNSNVILGTTNADCILLLIYDPVKGVIANVHSGWRGTFKKIAVNTINKMCSIYNCNPKDIICCICPSIRKCHFEVEDDVKNMCVEIFENTGKLNDIIQFAGIKNNKNKWMIDTVLINKIMLKECGLKEENIIDCGICSVCNSKNVHSYRVEGKNFGLSTAIISK